MSLDGSVNSLSIRSERFIWFLTHLTMHNGLSRPLAAPLMLTYCQPRPVRPRQHQPLPPDYPGTPQRNPRFRPSHRERKRPTALCLPPQPNEQLQLNGEDKGLQFNISLYSQMPIFEQWGDKYLQLDILERKQTTNSLHMHKHTTRFTTYSATLPSTETASTFPWPSTVQALPFDPCPSRRYQKLLKPPKFIAKSFTPTQNRLQNRLQLLRWFIYPIWRSPSMPIAESYAKFFPEGPTGSLSGSSGCPTCELNQQDALRKVPYVLGDKRRPVLQSFARRGLQCWWFSITKMSSAGLHCWGFSTCYITKYCGMLLIDRVYFGEADEAE